MSENKRTPFGPVDRSKWTVGQHLFFWVLYLPTAAVVIWLGSILLTVLRS